MERERTSTNIAKGTRVPGNESTDYRMTVLLAVDSLAGSIISPAKVLMTQTTNNFSFKNYLGLNKNGYIVTL